LAALAIVIVVLIPSLFIYYAIGAQASYQEMRNTYLKREIALLDERIFEIKKIREKTQSLLSRKYIVENLSNSGKSEVAILNFFASSLPTGVQLTHITFNHGKLELQGMTQSAEGIDKFMRNMADAQYFVSPKLVSIVAVGSGKGGVQEFNITSKVDLSAEAKQTSSRNEHASSENSQSSSHSSNSTSAFSENSDASSTDGYNFLGWGIGLIVLAASIWMIRRILKSKVPNPNGSMIKRIDAEFASLDPKDLLTWGRLPRIAVLFELSVLMVVLSYLLIAPAWDDLLSQRYEESQLRDTFLAKKREAINHDLIKKQLIETQEAFGFLLKALPDHYDIGAFVSAVQRTAAKNGVSVEKIDTGVDSVVGVFAELPFQFHLSGTFDGIGHFVADLSKNKMMSNINKFELYPDESRSDKGRAMKLRLDATITIYRYFNEEEELAAQRRSSKSAGAKK
jgi:type IV pilus assembly protein PilO